MIRNINNNKRADYYKLINTTRWQKLRVEKLKSQPLCEGCLKKNRTTLAQEVHHIKPIESVVGFKNMERLAYSFENLMSLCRSCHAEIHAKSKSLDEKVKRKRLDKERFAEKFLR